MHLSPPPYFSAAAGPIPSELGNLAALQSLNLGHNQLSGKFLPFFCFSKDRRKSKGRTGKLIVENQRLQLSEVWNIAAAGWCLQAEEQM